MISKSQSEIKPTSSQSPYRSSGLESIININVYNKAGNFDDYLENIEDDEEDSLQLISPIHQS